MEIQKIIYDTARGIYNIEDKLSIATIFIFCWKLSNKHFAELLYTDDPSGFIEALNKEFSNADIDLTVRLNDKNIKDAFLKTRDEVKLKYDSDGFLMALYNNDEWAIAINEILQKTSTFKIKK